jgi:arylsulfatase A-like enzyme
MATFPHNPLITRRQALAAGAALGLAGLGCRGRNSNPVRKGPPNMVVFLADSWRGNHLGAFGYPLNLTPVMDRLAESAFMFTHCHAQATWTKPSIASLFTGLLPSVHQAGMKPSKRRPTLQESSQILRPETPTVAELLREAGYHTAWLVGNPLVAKAEGFDRGMDTKTEDFWATPAGHIDRVIEWLESNPPEPFFLFVHTMDPHFPFHPVPESYDGLFQEKPRIFAESLPEPDRTFMMRYLEDYDAFCEEHHGLVDFRLMEGPGAAMVKRLYDAEIHGVDHHFGRLLAFMERRGLLDNTAITVTGDHGQAFGEHGEYYHEKPPWQHQLHVPLILRLPGQTRGARVPHAVALYDLLPTFLGLAGVPVPDHAQGEALVSATGELHAKSERAVCSEFDQYRIDTSTWDLALVRGQQKVILWGKDARIAGYDLAKDPGELHDVFSTGTPAAGFEELRHEVERRFAQHQERAREFGPPQWTGLPREHVQEIEALGYF